MNKITIYEYLANQAPEASLGVIKSFGYGITNCKSNNDVAICLKKFIKSEQERGLQALAMIHPDRELILSTANSNFGVDGFRDTAAANAQAALPINQPVQQQKENHTALLMVGLLASAMFLSVALISNKH